jgi:hypothetical protein
MGYRVKLKLQGQSGLRGSMNGPAWHIQAVGPVAFMAELDAAISEGLRAALDGLLITALRNWLQTKHATKGAVAPVGRGWVITEGICMTQVRQCDGLPRIPPAR